MSSDTVINLEKNLKTQWLSIRNALTALQDIQGFLQRFFLNLMQRMSQLLVSFMIFMSMGEGVKKAMDVSVIQCFVAMGSNCVPIPGQWGLLIIS